MRDHLRRARPLRTVAAVSISASFALACTLITQLDDSAYGNGGSDAFAGDGVAPVVDSAPGDEHETDAGSDALTAFSCADAKVAFCDDFERTSVLGQWTSATQSGGGTATLTDSGAHGSVLQLAGCSGTQCTAGLVKHIDATVTRATYAFDVQMVTPLAGSLSFSGLNLSLPDGRQPQAFLLLVGPNEVDLGHQTNLPDGGDAQYAGVKLVSAFPVGTWVRVEMDFDFGATPTATVKVDGTLYAMSPLPPSFVPAVVDIVAGNFYSSGASNMTILIDNVTFDYSL